MRRSVTTMAVALFSISPASCVSELVAVEMLYRVRLEINNSNDGDSENVGARGCTIHYETDRL